MAKKTVLLIALLLMDGPFQARMPLADQVSVRFTEGLLHGFVAVRTLGGKTLAIGDSTQVAEGDHITSKLTIKFRDGSVDEETTVFSQHDKFQVLQYRILQKGPTFKNPLDATINASTGQITGHYTEDNGQDKELNEQLEMAPDLANGMVPTLLKNIPASGGPISVSMVVFTPKPRIVKLSLTPQGDDFVSVGGTRRKAKHFLVKVELGAIAGVVAPLIGKQPPDFNIWILDSEAPVFLRSEGPMYAGGAVWRIEFIGPTWPVEAPARPGKRP